MGKNKKQKNFNNLKVIIKTNNSNLKLTLLKNQDKF